MLLLRHEVVSGLQAMAFAQCAFLKRVSMYELWLLVVVVLGGTVQL